jgi:N-acetylneuraminic acid mutarotase
MGFKVYWSVSSVHGHIPDSREGATLLQMNKKIVLFGGRNKKINNDVYILNLDTKTWSRIITLHAPLPRFGDSVVSHHNQIFQFGGWVSYDRKKSIRICKNSMYCINLEDRHWSKCPVTGPKPKARRN